MRKMKTRVLAMALAFFLVVGMIPTNVLAAENGGMTATTAESSLEALAAPTGDSDGKATVPTEGGSTAASSEGETTTEAPTSAESSEVPTSTDATPTTNAPTATDATPTTDVPATTAAPVPTAEVPAIGNGISQNGLESDAKLTDLELGTAANISSSNQLALTPAFSSEELNYTAAIYRKANANLFVKVTAENAESIVASFLANGAEVPTTVDLTSGAAKGVSLTGVLKNGTNILTITVKDAANLERVYTVELTQQPALNSLAVYTQAQNIAALTPNFKSATLEYSVVVPSEDSTFTVAPSMYQSTGDVQEITVGGIVSDPQTNSGNVTLELPDEDQFTVPIVAKDTTGEATTETTYQLHVTKSYPIKFQTEPAFAVVSVINSEGTSMNAVNGVYTLPAGAYTYEVTANGFKTLQKSLTVGKGQPVLISDTLEKSEDYTDVSYVENLITFIGGVTLNGDSKTRIDAARAAYNALQETEKLTVSNYDVLVEAEHYYNQLRDKAGNVDPESALNWNQFLGNEDLKGISDAKTPQSGSDLTEKWKIQATGGNTMMQHVSAPAYYDGFVYYTSDSKVRKVDPESGEILAESEAPGSMMLLPQVTCGDGKVFAMTNEEGSTRIRVYRADTLELLYRTVALQRAQIETPIMYHDGYFYLASYGKGAYYAFIATDEKLNFDISPEWTVEALSTTSQGFLWGGAEFVGDYAYFGDTDGRFYAVNATTGQVVDTFMLGSYQVQSTPNYYAKNQRLYLSLGMNGGAILSIKVNADGTFDRDSQKWFISDVPGTGMKSSVVIYNDRLYVCGGGGHGGSGEPFRVIDANTMTEIYRIDEIASKGSPVLSTAYATEENNHKVYLYVVPYRPEGTYPDRISNMYIIQDSIGQTEPIYEKVENVGVGQYCSQSITIGSNGLLYYYNDANYLYAYGLDDLADRLITGADVDQQIARQPEVDEYRYYNNTEIQRIKDRYDALSDAEKGKVTQYQKLLDILAVASMDPVERINNGIASLPEVDAVTLADRDKIETLYNGYQGLEDSLKEQVANSKKLEDAYAKIAVLERQAVIDAIIADIAKLPADAQIVSTNREAIYGLVDRVNALGEEDAAKVTNKARLDAAKARMDQVIAQRNAVDQLIQDTLNGVTVTSKNRQLLDAIDKAAEGLVASDVMSLESYEYYVSPARVSLINSLIKENNLSSQLAVTDQNAGALQSILDEITKQYEGVLEADRKYLENYAAVAAVQAKIDAAKENYPAVRDVEKKISAIGTVTADSQAAISAARQAYNRLTEAQRKLVSNYGVLTAAEASYKDLTTGVKGFVTRLYKNVLGRNPDAGGLQDWVNALNRREKTGAQVAAGFIFSNEYQEKMTSNEAFIKDLYRAMFDRNPDRSGMNGWMSYLSNGVTRQYVFTGFIYSQEFKELCASFGIVAGDFHSSEIVDQNADVTAFVSRMYTKCLNRNWDKTGLYDWTERLLSKKIGGGELAKGFFNSQEFLEKNYSNQEFVIRCYRTFLNREPDAVGLADWTGRLSNGWSRNAILDGFIWSQEFGELCGQYGIDR